MSRPVDAALMRSVMSRYATGVAVVTAMVDGRPEGMTCSSVTSVSLDPPLVGFFPARSSRTWARMRTQPKLCFNVLGKGHQELCRSFAALEGDRFSGVAYRVAPSGSPVLEAAIAWIDCELHAEMAAGDHTVVLARPIEMDAHPDASPLVVFGGRYGHFADPLEP